MITSEAMPWDFILLFLLLGVVSPWHGAIQVRRLMRAPEITTADRLAVYASTIGFQWAIALVALWRAKARGFSFAMLGLALPSPGRAAGLAVVLSLVLVAYQLASLRKLARLPAERQGFAGLLIRRLFPQNHLEAAVFFAVTLTAGLCEEFLYRGFVLGALAGNAATRPALGIFGSAALFAVAHLYQGATGLVTTFIWGAGFAAAKVWTGSLLPTIVAHFFVDLVAGLAGPRLVSRSSST
jgi:membrane protease YdiL (CAAX protease family)